MQREPTQIRWRWAILPVTLLALGVSGTPSIGRAISQPVSAATPFAGVRIITPSSTTCASSDAGVSLRSSRPGDTASMVPPGAEALTICRYNGMNALGGAPQWGLRGRGATSDPRTVGAIARALNALEPTPPGEVFSCPFDDGSNVVAFFGYVSGVADPVTVDTGGCAGVTNGHVSRMFGGAIARQMLALVKPVQLVSATLEGTIAGCVRAQLPAGNCPDPNRITVRIGRRWVGLVQPVQGHFRLRLASSGRATIDLDGEGQRVNAVIATATATVRIGHTTKVVLVPRPFGTVRGRIRGCGRAMSVPCSTSNSPHGLSVRVQTPTQHRSGNLVTFQPVGDRFQIPLAPGRYRFTLLDQTGHLIRGVTGSMVTVRAHHATDAVLTIPTG